MDYAYLRVSTREQAITGAGLGAQRADDRPLGRRRGAAQVALRRGQGPHGGQPAAGRASRPSLQAPSRPGDTLVVSKLEPLSRSVQDFASLLARARKGGWALICLDVGVDMTTPAGEMVANVMAAFAQYERQPDRPAHGGRHGRQARSGHAEGPDGRLERIPIPCAEPRGDRVVSWALAALHRRGPRARRDPPAARSALAPLLRALPDRLVHRIVEGW